VKLSFVVAALTVLWTPAALRAQRDLHIRWYDAVGVAEGEAERARTTAGEVLRRSGLEVTWRRCVAGADAADADACATPVTSDEIIVRIIKTPRRATLPPNALGYARANGLGHGGLTTLLLDRVEKIARRAGVRLGQLLGRVLVHEIGHLGTLTHAPQGLMRNEWAIEELRDESQERWTFSAPEAAQLRAAFAANLAATR
jgi:hypothetical protein